LFVILGYAERLLAARPLNQSSHQGLNAIKHAAESAAAITQRLLKLGRQEPADHNILNLNRLIGDSDELLRPLGGPSISWRFNLDKDLGTVRADPAQLQQILMNLVVNARDAMPEGGKLTVETSNVHLPRPGPLGGPVDAFISLRVTDTGTGMSAETADRLFDPFFTTKAQGKGTGLGLSIVHSIVAGLGGTIHVDSKLGQGASFTVYIPRAEALAVGPFETVGDDCNPVGVEPRVAITVLLVEGQEEVRRLLSSNLAGAGCRVLEADNGEDAVRMANQYKGRIDLLITDAVMPKASGFEVARTLSRQRSEMKTIFISGYLQDLRDGGENVPDGSHFLPKPFVKAELLRHVEGLLEQVRASARLTIV
jgi:two-component system, cell cycle sensor histidine kinase and response regulator CckA